MGVNSKCPLFPKLIASTGPGMPCQYKCHFFPRALGLTYFRMRKEKRKSKAKQNVVEERYVGMKGTESLTLGLRASCLLSLDSNSPLAICGEWLY